MTVSGNTDLACVPQVAVAEQTRLAPWASDLEFPQTFRGQKKRPGLTFGPGLTYFWHTFGYLPTPKDTKSM